MKLFFSLILLCVSTFSHAALFDFASGAAIRSEANQRSVWAVDVGTARQWYFAWAASADRVYQHLITPKVHIPGKTSATVSTSALLSRSVFVGVVALLATAFLLALTSFSKVMLVSRQQVARTAG